MHKESLAEYVLRTMRDKELSGNDVERRSNKGRAEVKRNRMLTYEEEERLLAACRPHHQSVTYTRKHKNTGKPETLTQSHYVDRSVLLPYIFCSLDATMRRNEIFQMRWWQIDFANHVIYLTEEAARQTKTGAGGILPLTDRLAFELLKVRNASRSVKDNDLVLGSADFRTAWENACSEAKITDLQFRDLRATGSTRMLLSGSVGEIVRKITRHTQAQTHLDHYTLVDASNARLVGQKLQDFNEKQGYKVKVKGDDEKKASGI